MLYLVGKLSFLFLTYINVDRACAQFPTRNQTCRDQSLNCLFWKQRSFCTAGGIVGKMMLHLCKRSCGYCGSVQAECGKSFLSCEDNSVLQASVGNGWPYPQGRIVGGDTTVAGEVPWQVYIDVNSINRKSKFCGAAILTQMWIVSAGHCYYRGWDELNLKFGSVYNNNQGRLDDNPLQTQSLQTHLHRDNVIIHPEYVHRTKNNDIALIKLTHPLTYTNEIRPVCLPSPDDYQEGLTGIVTGWGDLSYKGRPSNILMKACLKVRDCNQFAKYSTITENMICAYEDAKDACQGDSGGPLVAKGQDGRFVLLGIVSKGKGCAKKGVPGVYTKVSNYLFWIKNVTSERI